MTVRQDSKADVVRRTSMSVNQVLARTKEPASTKEEDSAAFVCQVSKRFFLNYLLPTYNGKHFYGCNKIIIAVPENEYQM